MTSQTKLSNRHGELDARIQAEMKRPQPDSVRLQSLKKEKLHIKEMLVVG